MADEKKEWLTVRETAERLGLHEEAVRRRIRAFKLPAARAWDGPRAPWRVNAIALERQLAREAETAARHKRLAGVVSGYGDFEEDLEASDLYVSESGDPADAIPPAEDFRRRRVRRELLEEAARVVDAAGLEQDFTERDEEEAIEREAQRLAAIVRRRERIQRRALEILENEDENE